MDKKLRKNKKRHKKRRKNSTYPQKRPDLSRVQFILHGLFVSW
ncbi:hypothetical protein HMPREF1864_00636 [Peptoniphilus sp. DNF00840]|nr:hypothetical protein HMPREF1864_00636 [Peptoniphilus sp. DNF00840]